jgi:uncharacterized repeat protein (TIGR03943 family)
LLERIVFRWRGIALSLLAVAATVWLAWSGRLGLYIHPRYFVFTTVMAVIGGLMVLAAFALVPLRDSERAGLGEHDRDHDGDTGHGAADDHVHARRRWPAVSAAASLALVVIAGIALVVLPPASLSTGSVNTADLSAGDAITASIDDESQRLVGADYADFTVKDWAALLRQGVDEQFLSGAEADVVGFVIADEADPDNVFYLARYVVTCCAVDAQPVGIAVYSPGWQDDVEAGEWVQVAGGFVGNPSTTNTEPLLLEADSLMGIDEPSEPYVY